MTDGIVFIVWRSQVRIWSDCCWLLIIVRAGKYGRSNMSNAVTKCLQNNWSYPRFSFNKVLLSTIEYYYRYTKQRYTRIVLVYRLCIISSYKIIQKSLYDLIKNLLIIKTFHSSVSELFFIAVHDSASFCSYTTNDTSTFL